MTAHTLIVQPQGFRKQPDHPEWIYCANAQILIGIGAGLRETLSHETLCELSRIILPAPHLDYSPPLVALLDASRDHYQFNTSFRDYAPELIIEAADGDNVFRLTEDDAGTLCFAPHKSSKPGPRDVTLDGRFAYDSTHDGDGYVRIALYLRKLRLKDEHRPRIAAGGFAAWRREFLNSRMTSCITETTKHLEPQFARIAADEARRTTARLEHARREALTSIARRLTPELQKPREKQKQGKKASLQPPTKKSDPPTAQEKYLPNVIREHMHAIARERISEISRNATDADGNLLKPLSERVLLEKAIAAVAHKKALALLYDQSHAEIAHVRIRWAASAT